MLPFFCPSTEGYCELCHSTQNFKILPHIHDNSREVLLFLLYVTIIFRVT